MRSGVAKRPTTSGFLETLHFSGQRHAGHQRYICGLNAAIGQIDRSGLRSPRHTHQDHVSFLQIIGLLTVVVQHRVIECVDTAKVLCVQGVLRTNLMVDFAPRYAWNRCSTGPRIDRHGKPSSRHLPSSRSTRPSSSSV